MTIQKISVVTVCLNARDSIRLTMESVRKQSFYEVEHVIVDGGSTDGTQQIALEYDPSYFVSEPDRGVYDAMDKGAAAATGDVLIFLNAGDTFYDDETCEDVAAFFDESGADIVFGNLMPVYLHPTDSHDHGAFVAGKLLDLGYVRDRHQLYDESIHHQATFYRRWIFDRCTYVCPAPEATGEYNLLLNAVMKQRAKVKHIPRGVSRFVLGGISTRDFKKEWAKYNKARTILRQMYFSSGKPAVRDGKPEFVHGDAGLAVPPSATAAHWKQRLKQLIKGSLLFRSYDRVALGITSRIVNVLSPRIEAATELLAQRLYHDVRFVVEANLQAHLAETLRYLHSSGMKETLAAMQSTQVDTLKAVRDSETRARLNSNDISKTLAATQSDFADAVLAMKDSNAHVRLDVNAVSTAMGALQGANAEANQSFHRLHFELERMRQQLDQIRINQAQIRFADDASSDFVANGFRVFSQWDEDGLIQYLVSRIPDCDRRFVEFGVGDYTEANTRLLLERDNWSGLVLECSAGAVDRIRASDYHWRHSLTAVCAFIDRDNVNQLIGDNGFAGEIGLLSIDVDGVDYWIWDAIRVVSPQIVVCEYNGAFGSVARVTVPYKPDFDRAREHSSMIYAGASLGALESLGRRKGYTLVGTNGGGNNAFFVRDDVLARSDIRISNAPFTRPRFREARNPDGTLAFLDVADAIQLVADKPVIDVESGEQVKIGDLQLCYGGGRRGGASYEGDVIERAA